MKNLDDIYEIIKRKAIDLLKSQHYTEALDAICEAIKNDMEKADGYNLMGIYYELKGNINKAIKFYRIAYFFDQTYTPALLNMERVGGFSSCSTNIVYDKNDM